MDVLRKNIELFATSVSTLPRSNVIGMFLGTLTFVVTISVVVYLVIAGGSIERIKAQELERKKGPSGETIGAEGKAIRARATLLDDLVQSRSRMMKGGSKMDGKGGSLIKSPPSLTSKVSSCPPDEGVYKEYYRRFMSTKGPSIASGLVPGKPNATVEAYCLGLASQVPPYMNPPNSLLVEYARQYARIYSSLASSGGVKANEKYEKLYKECPSAIVGKRVYLVPFNVHQSDKSSLSALESLAKSTDGSPFNGEPYYEPDLVWAFHSTKGGPFKVSVPG